MRSNQDAVKRQMRIRDRAFEEWNHAGGPAGRDDEFWKKGEELVDKEYKEEEETKRRRDEEAKWQQPGGAPEGPPRRA